MTGRAREVLARRKKANADGVLVTSSDARVFGLLDGEEAVRQRDVGRDSTMRNAKRVVGGVALTCLIVMLLALAGQAANGTSAEQVTKEVGEAIESIKAYSADRRDEAMAKARAAIQRLDRHIARLEDRADARGDRMDRAARERLRAALKALRKQRNDLAEWSGRMRESSAEAWDHVKQGFVESYRALADAFAKAEHAFE